MTQALAVRLNEFGGTDVMRLETIALPAPAPGEVLLRQTAVGFNFIDIYQRPRP
jgi:NADPH2:quinone reductase